MTIGAGESAPYLPDYVGARGLAARLAWEDYDRAPPPLDPAAPLMVMPGALTGSHAPYAGRTCICGFAPQAWPHAWFSRSNIGGHFGGELKRAGYDGIVVTGSAETPVWIRIRDDEVSILPADDLWGLDTMETLVALEGREGRGVRSLVIGPAGERLSRIATIHTASSSAAGQGGFGATMGSKKLKAISVVGTGRVRLAQPEKITALARALARLRSAGPICFGGDIEALNRDLAAAGDGRARCHACAEGCVTPCNCYFEDVPGVVYPRKWSGEWFCVSAAAFPGLKGQGSGPYGSDERGAERARKRLDWRLDRRAAFEMNVLSDRYGLNQYDLLIGLAPWLIACQKAGLISELNGLAMDWDLPHFWAGLLHAMAYREGLGDALAEGGWTASRQLRLGEDIARELYAGWGYAAHYDGHALPHFPFPYWLVSALQWLADTRDPFGGGHGYIWAAAGMYGLFAAETEAERQTLLGKMRSAAERAYGDPDVLDPYSGYTSKAYAGFYHTLRAALVDCVPVEDFSAPFPLIWDAAADDGFRVLSNVPDCGDVPGPSVEHRLFTAGAGLDWSEEEFERAGQRIWALERALQVRYFGRDRQTDELVLPYFERTETAANPLLGERRGLDREQFRPVLDEFYRLHGCDPATGWPTQERLSELGMADVYEPMIAGATPQTLRVSEDP